MEHIYVIGVAGSSLVKIGKARNPEIRLRQRKYLE